jgi:hypothetical protein
VKPWDTPQRAAPKSCYPCKNKTEKIKKIKIKIKKTTEKKKNNPRIPKRIQKKAPKKRKNRTNSTKRIKKNGKV